MYKKLKYITKVVVLMTALAAVDVKASLKEQVYIVSLAKRFNVVIQIPLWELFRQQQPNIHWGKARKKYYQHKAIEAMLEVYNNDIDDKRAFHRLDQWGKVYYQIIISKFKRRFFPKIANVSNFEISQEESDELKKEVQKANDSAPSQSETVTFIEVNGKELFETFIDYQAHDLLALLLKNKWFTLDPTRQYLHDAVLYCSQSIKGIFRDLLKHRFGDPESVIETMKVLFEQGANPKVPLNEQYRLLKNSYAQNNKVSFPPLNFLACPYFDSDTKQYNYSTKIKSLRQYPISRVTDEIDEERCKIMKFWLEYPHPLDQKQYEMAIHEAMQKHNFCTDLSDLIIEYAGNSNAEINKEDSFHRRPLDYVAPDSKTAKMLRDHGALPSQNLTHMPKSSHSTPSSYSHYSYLCCFLGMFLPIWGGREKHQKGKKKTSRTNCKSEHHPKKNEKRGTSPVIDLF